MKFSEKLAKLTAGLNKSKLARAAGLPSGAVSDYINKNYVPRLDAAESLAKALNVSLAWLADDAAGWPPPAPAQGAANAALISDTELMLEIARRMRLKQIDLLEQIERI